MIGGCGVGKGAGRWGERKNAQFSRRAKDDGAANKKEDAGCAQGCDSWGVQEALQRAAVRGLSEIFMCCPALYIPWGNTKANDGVVLEGQGRQV